MQISSEAQNVLEAIKKFQPVRPNLLVENLGMSEKTIYKHLARLLSESLVTKIGSSGKSFYLINQKSKDINIDPLNLTDLLIEQNYIYVSPSGEIIRGLNGFNEWCIKNNMNFEKQKSLYATRLKDLGKIRIGGLISAKKRILPGTERVLLNDVFFSDFYTFDHFGKTRLGQLIYVAKTSQNIDLIREISMSIKPAILKLIEKYNVQQVCFIPPTIDRKIQIMDELKKFLNLDLTEIRIEKVTSKTKVAQKTLRKLEDRIANARTTMAVDPNQKITGNVLIIDDATGSGATLNETAKKILNITNAKVKIIGYTVVGSFKGFDVISEI